MTNFIFTYRTGSRTKTMTILAASMTDARAQFDSKRPARAMLLQVSEY